MWISVNEIDFFLGKWSWSSRPTISFGALSLPLGLQTRKQHLYKCQGNYSFSLPFFSSLWINYSQIVVACFLSCRQKFIKTIENFSARSCLRCIEQESKRQTSSAVKWYATVTKDFKYFSEVCERRKVDTFWMRTTIKFLKN